MIGRDVQQLFCCAAEHCDAGAHTDLLVSQDAVKCIYPIDGLATELHDQIAGSNPGGLYLATRLCRLDEDAESARKECYKASWFRPVQPLPAGATMYASSLLR